MKLKVKKTEGLKGEITPPSSKSHTIRALIAALLAKGKTAVKNPLESEDTRNALTVCRKLGARVSIRKNAWLIESGGLPIGSNPKGIYCGNSGITTRFILPILGLRHDCDRVVEVDCGEQMKKRPMDPLVSALNCLGMKIKTGGSYWPLRVSGKLTGGKVEIDGVTSQYLSALLLSLPCAERDSVVAVKNLRERPYAEMTELWLREQRIRYSHFSRKNKDIYEIKGGQKYHPFSRVIPGDFSSASCFLAAGAIIKGKTVVSGLDMDDSQGDKKLISILRRMGAGVEIGKNKITLPGGKRLKGIKVDAGEIPDLVPALAVLGTQADGKTEISNVMQARMKETDRIHSMAEGLSRMGARIKETKDGLVVYKSILHGNKLRGYGDHRTVMALSLAGMIADGETEIDSAESVSKTFPAFFEEMKKLGAKMDTRTEHTILLGFKHSGKTVVGRELALKMGRPFFDLDEWMEKEYEKKRGKKLSVRLIMLENGESFFRDFEHGMLKKVLKKRKSSVIALGGGTPVKPQNRELIEEHTVILVSAPRGILYERIAIKGRPAFFREDESAISGFERTIAERQPIFESLAHIKAENKGSVKETVDRIMEQLSTLK